MLLGPGALVIFVEVCLHHMACYSMHGRECWLMHGGKWLNSRTTGVWGREWGKAGALLRGMCGLGLKFAQHGIAVGFGLEVSILAARVRAAARQCMHAYSRAGSGVVCSSVRSTLRWVRHLLHAWSKLMHGLSSRTRVQPREPDLQRAAYAARHRIDILQLRRRGRQPQSSGFA